jgi:hypothetical protein
MWHELRDLIRAWSKEKPADTVANSVDGFSWFAVISQVGAIGYVIPEFNSSIHEEVIAVIRTSFCPNLYCAVAVQCEFWNIIFLRSVINHLPKFHVHRGASHVLDGDGFI